MKTKIISEKINYKGLWLIIREVELAFPEELALAKNRLKL
jgi:hypothetical protein